MIRKVEPSRSLIMKKAGTVFRFPRVGALIRSVHPLFLILPLLFVLLQCGEDEEKEEGKGKARKGASEQEVSPNKGQDSRTERQLDSLEKGVRELNQRVQEAPQNPELYYERAGFKKELGRTAEAIDDMERAMRIDSTRSPFHKRMADLQFRAQRIEEARSHYRKAIALDGDNTDALVGIAELFLALREYQKAVDYADEALKVDEHLAQPYVVKGQAFEKTGDTSRAITTYQTAVEMDPENYSVFLQLGYLMHSRGDDLAIEYYNTASRIRPEAPEPLYNKGLYLQKNGRYDEAVDVYKKLIDQNEGHVEGYYNIGYIQLVYKGNYEEAVNWFDKVVAVTPDYHQAVYNRGLSYENLEKKDSAIMDYRKALKLKSDYTPAAKGLNRLNAEYQPR